MPGTALARGPDHVGRDVLLHVVIERFDDLGLRAIALHDDRQRLETVERLVQRRLADAARPRLGADRGEPLREGRRLRRLRYGRVLREEEREAQQQT